MLFPVRVVVGKTVGRGGFGIGMTVKPVSTTVLRIVLVELTVPILVVDPVLTNVVVVMGTLMLVGMLVTSVRMAVKEAPGDEVVKVLVIGPYIMSSTPVPFRMSESVPRLMVSSVSLIVTVGVARVGGTLKFGVVLPSVVSGESGRVVLSTSIPLLGPILMIVRSVASAPVSVGTSDPGYVVSSAGFCL